MRQQRLRQKFQPPRLKPVLDFAEIWFQETSQITFHDPLAATTIFNQDICAFERGWVEVELTSQRANGMTYWSPDASGPHEVALEVDPPAFFEHYFSFFD